MTSKIWALRKIFLIVIVGILGWSQSVALGSEKQKDLDAVIASLSPLPDEPSIKGLRYSFWYALRDLRELLIANLNPKDEKRYIYRAVAEGAPNVLSQGELIKLVYESVRTDYLWLLESGKIDLYVSPFYRAADEAHLPSDIRTRLKLADSLSTNFFMVNHDYANLVTIFGNVMFDQRNVHEFLGWVVHLGSKFGPLESMESLSRMSSRSGLVISRLNETFRRKIDELTGLSSSLVEKTLRGETVKTSEFQEYQKTIEELRHRLSYIVRTLYTSVQYANDMVRNKNVSDVTALKNVVAQLGTGLKSALVATETFRQLGVTGGRNWVGEGVELSNPFEDLKRIFGVGAHYSTTISEVLKQDGDAKGYELYTDTLVIQYILVTGSIMAKLAEISEGRGSLGDRMLQETRYRAAQLQGFVKDKTTDSLPRGKSVALAKRGGEILGKSPIQRREFAAPALNAKRLALEDELWQIFFDNAEISMGGQNHWKSRCALLLTAKAKADK